MRPGRAGIPISVKLVVAASLVVAVVAGAVTWIAQREIAAITDEQLAQRRRAGELAIDRASDLVLHGVIGAIRYPLATNAYAELQPVLDGWLAEDQRSTASRLRWLAVYYFDKLVARTGATPGDLPAPRPPRGEPGELERVYSQDVKVGAITVGTLRIGVSTTGLVRELDAALAQSQAGARAARDRALLVSLLVLGLGVVVAALQGAQLARPIRQLTAQAERIAGGDLVTRVPEGRRDELGVLARAFNAMSARIQLLLAAHAAKVALERELALARQVQQAMLPPDALDQHGALRVIGYCLPASSCGGDWWMYRKLSGGRLLIVLGDATGHGIHSAMIAATARGAVEGLTTLDEQVLTPDQVLRAIDAAIRQLGDHDVMMTGFAAVIDGPAATLHYANAGHNAPYVVGRGAGRALDQPRVLAGAGNPLGDRQIAVAIERGARALEPGDLLVCFTDGLVERANPAGALFGDRRLRRALVGASLGDAAELVALRDRLVRGVERFADGSIAEDDVTLVLCELARADDAGALARGAA